MRKKVLGGLGGGNCWPRKGAPEHTLALETAEPEYESGNPIEVSSIILLPGVDKYPLASCQQSRGIMS